MFSLWSLRSMKLAKCYVTIYKPAVKFQVGHCISHLKSELRLVNLLVFGWDDDHHPAFESRTIIARTTWNTKHCPSVVRDCIHVSPF